MCVYMSMMKNNVCIIYVHLCVGAQVCTCHSVCVCKDQGWCPSLPFNLFETRSPYCSKQHMAFQLACELSGIPLSLLSIILVGALVFQMCAPSLAFLVGASALQMRAPKSGFTRVLYLVVLACTANKAKIFFNVCEYFQLRV